ncbi:hypothetical protein JF73_18130 (plasmid) [Lactobacillus helsingborgensis]|uniref:Uncharacterized protein n=2 Tax=Lactobacillus TaxID=1578 RepID=A0AA47B5L2_9LACO|nr:MULTISPECIES: hypothetical protein [Lactobacillus]KJY54792.1 hypothetical protein JF74_19790 [Lactobacillus melliventris]KJY60387.1 hypothetical protein JF73_18130 [Lactobacillus helsingborgensis]UZX30571.1 hypothetical protein LDX53_09340 [Lactobacillus helsingborgensis]UZX32390.1 hypothetical protein LDX52_09460 [Lactobacillus helsingborgensis]
MRNKIEPLPIVLEYQSDLNTTIALININGKELTLTLSNTELNSLDLNIQNIIRTQKLNIKSSKDSVIIPSKLYKEFKTLAVKYQNLRYKNKLLEHERKSQ